MSQSVVSILEATRSAPPPYPAPGCDANPLQVTPSILMHIHHPFTLLGRERHCENKVYCQTTQCNKQAMMQTQTSSPTVQWTECKGGKKGPERPFYLPHWLLCLPEKCTICTFEIKHFYQLKLF